MQLRTHLSLASVLAIILYAGWWMAGDSEPSTPAPPPPNATKGPMEPDFCGPLQGPRPAPPVESPFGIHLYATTPKGEVHALPAIEIVDALPPPEGKAVISRKPAPPDLPLNDTAFDDVQTVQVLLDEFCRAFGAMPTGELNDEIVRRLQGENPKGIAVLPKAHPSISAEGELLDRWGTPYRFHPESSWHMSIRSAGPDREMWTADDVLTDENPLTTQL